MEDRSHYSVYESPYGGRAPRDGRLASVALVTFTLLAIVGSLAGILFIIRDGDTMGRHDDQVVSRPDYPATLAVAMSQPEGNEWILPADVTFAGGDAFVLDGENGRILRLDPRGAVAAVLGGAADSTLALETPMAIDSDGESLFVASSLSGEVLVLDLSGHVRRTLAVPTAPGDVNAPRPIGLALTADGDIAVSDADNHRVVIMSGEGTVLRTVGSGARAGGEAGFNVPGALTVDAVGDIYVVDTLNGRVVKLSPEGEFLGQFGERGDAPGRLARPKGVAVDAEGRVFVSDGLLAAIDVFSPQGRYLGVIRPDGSAVGTSGPLFQAPAGLWLNGDLLYVVDRLAGLITLDLGDRDAASAAAD